MLQDIRSSLSGTAAKIIIGLIVVSFAIFGIESILLGGGSSGVAEVNGEEISPVELQQLVNTQKRRLMQVMGDQLDPAMLDDQLLSGQALETLIGRKLLLQHAKDLKLTASEQMVGRVIGGMEQFQLDGQFSAEMYRNLVSSAGFTPAGFQESLRQDLVVNQLRSGLAGSEFVTPAELQINALISGEQRDIRYLVIPLESELAAADISEQAVRDYYEANQQEFLTAEAVELDYIELTAEDFFQPVAEDVLQQEYEATKENYQYQTERRVSHILFEPGADESDEDLQARIGKVQEALAAGADFAELAAQYSNDIGSAAAGGDIGFTTGETFPEAMEEALAEMEVNEISGQVRTEAGVHLIKVTELRAGAMPTLEELRPQLELSIQQSEAGRELLRVVETLKDLAFNADGLEGPAAELGLTVKRSERLNRNQAVGLFAQPALLNAAFSAEVLVEKHNSEVIELPGGRHVVLRVREHHTPQVRSLDEVSDNIATRLTESAARQAVSARAESILSQLQRGGSVESIALEAGFDWQVELGAQRTGTAVPPSLLTRAFSLPAPEAGQSAFEFVMDDNGDALVFELFRVTSGELAGLTPLQRQQLIQGAVGESARLLDLEYQQGLRERADITVL